MAERIVIFSRVVSIENRAQSEWVTGYGDKAVFRKIPLGYFMFLSGSYEAIHVGFDPPEFVPGDRIKITFEKV